MENFVIDVLTGFQNRVGLYFGIGGVLSFFIYFIYKQNHIRFKIQVVSHKWKDVKREIKYSLCSLFIFSILFIGLVWLTQNGYTLIYEDKKKFGVAYYYLSVFLSLIVHDAYFYFTHRLLHTRWLMRKVHSIHHLSHDPTLWAVFSFHPIEAIINFGVFFVLTMCVPLHQSIFFMFFIFNTSNNVLGHCGFEVFPKKFTRHWLGKWITTSTHHNMHHKYGSGNYALYFTWLDNVLNTDHPNYHAQFDSVVSKRKNNN